MMKVLFATDGLPPALAAGRLLARVADPHRVEITTLTVFETVIRSAANAFPDIVLDHVSQRARWASETADAAAEIFLRGGFKARAMTADGDPGEQIIRAVADAGSDVAVLGAGRKGWLGNVLLGSVSLHVLHSSSSSVLLAHETYEGHGPFRIVLGTDGSRGAAAAMRTLSELADFEKCEVRVVAVAHTAPEISVPLPGVFLPPSVAHDAELVRQLRERAEMSAHKAVADLRSAGFRAEARVREGHPVRQLLSVAERSHADLLVVGSRGLGPVRRALMGSVSDRVAAQAPATLVARSLIRRAP